MNPVASQEVNRVRHQDLQRANEARRLALTSGRAQRGLVKRLLSKLRGFAGPKHGPAGVAGEQPEGGGVMLRDGT
jgi:hypothetical protein